MVAAARDQHHDHGNDDNEGDPDQHLDPSGHPDVRRVQVLFHVTQFCETLCRCQVVLYRSRYASRMPKVWAETIDRHRSAVRDAILDTTAALATEHGVASVTMTRVAEETGIGRATLYKYFSSIEAILLAWHERQVNAHVTHLTAVVSGTEDATARLQTVLETYALMTHRHRGNALAATLHSGEHIVRAQHQLASMISGLLDEAKAAGAVRTDVASRELSAYCLHALGAAATLPSATAVRRLVMVVLDGLR
jgi:AcrR family transcriptional regulator